MPQTFYTLLTQTGAADFTNAQVFGVHVPVTHIAVGDGGGQPVFPVEPAVALVGERWRAPITEIRQDESNPNWLIVEAVIPANVGGWTVREIGLIGGLNPDNLTETPTTPGQKLLAHGNFPATYKPLLSEGAAKDLAIRMIVQVSNASLVQLTIDPAVVVATKKSVEQAIQSHRTESDPHPDRYAPLAHTSEPDPHPQYFNESRLENRLEQIVGGTLHYVGQVWQIVPDAAALSDPVVTGPPAGRPDGRRVIVTDSPASATGHAMAVWNAAGSAWVLSGLALSVFDLYGCDLDSHGYYWFGDGWNLLDLDNIGEATETTPGVIRLATNAEAAAGTAVTAAIRPAQLKTAIDAAKADEATETTPGVIRLATNAEAAAGTAVTAAIRPAQLKTAIDAAKAAAAADAQTKASAAQTAAVNQALANTTGNFVSKDMGALAVGVTLTAICHVGNITLGGGVAGSYLQLFEPSYDNNTNRINVGTWRYIFGLATGGGGMIAHLFSGVFQRIA